MAVFTVALAASSAGDQPRGRAPRVTAASCWSWTPLTSYAPSAWVGGLVHLIAAAFGRPREPWPVALLQALLDLALGAVGGPLVVAGVGLTCYYVDGLAAFTGPAYGMMVMTKIVILAPAPDRWARSTSAWCGGCAAAEVVAAPPAPLRGGRARPGHHRALRRGLADLAAARGGSGPRPGHARRGGARASRPRLPSLTSPSLAEMPLDDRWPRATTRTARGTSSTTTCPGCLRPRHGRCSPSLHATGWAPWARHWPLVFFGLAAFMLVRNDPGSWPLGPQGFWEGMTSRRWCSTASSCCSCWASAPSSGWCAPGACARRAPPWSSPSCARSAARCS